MRALAPGITVPDVLSVFNHALLSWPFSFRFCMRESCGTLVVSDHFNGRTPGLLMVRYWGVGPLAPSVAVNERRGGSTTSREEVVFGGGSTFTTACMTIGFPALDVMVIVP